MFRSLLFCGLLSALPAFAFDVLLPSSTGLVLPGLALTSCAQADVCVRGKHLEARRGIRRDAGPGIFTDSIPVLLEESYRVRDASGTEYRMWVRGELEGMLWIEVLGESHPLPANPPSPAAGRFTTSQVRIGGEETDSRFPALQLKPDGTFQLGRTVGRWYSERRRVLLTGHFASWGPAELSPDAKSVIFRFRRGTVDFELTFARTEPVAEFVTR